MRNTIEQRKAVRYVHANKLQISGTVEATRFACTLADLISHIDDCTTTIKVESDRSALLLLRAGEIRDLICECLIVNGYRYDRVNIDGCSSLRFKK